MTGGILKGLGAFALAWLLAAHSASAQQSDWMKRGQDALGTLGRGSTAPAAPAASGGASALSVGDISAGLKEALRVGTEKVVGQLGAVDGFNKDPAIHIPLPDSLQTVKKALQTVGQGAMADDLELKLNRAAEVATPKAKELFVKSISEMTLDDAKAIYDGPKDAATRYFQGKMSAPLADAMRPVVDSSLSEVGAIQSYDSIMGQYKKVPFVPDVKANLTQHVLDKGMAGIFHYVAKEEAAIRENPAARTTDLLKKVFGN